MEIIKKHINLNYSKGVKIVPKYIVIHETDNERLGADAEAHYQYWNTNIAAQSSTHFVVDSNRVVQLLETNEKAWHVGDNKNYSDITNDNAIGIEICVNSDGVFSKAYENCIELVKKVMKDTNIPVDRVVRHYDASGKNCPRKIIATGKWMDFKNRIGGNGNMASVQEAKNYVGSRAGELQTKLIKLGYNVGKWGADGTFGQETYNALIRFQNDNKLTADGYAGKNTFSKLNELIEQKETPIPKAELTNFAILEGNKSIKSLITNTEYAMAAEATSPNGPLYEFWISDLSTNTWTKLNEYQTTSSIKFTVNKTGKHRVVVHVKDKYSKLDWDDYKAIDVIVKENVNIKEQLNKVVDILQNVIKNM